MIDAAEFVRVGMNVHEALLRSRHVEVGVPAGRNVAEARPDCEDQIRVANARGQIGHDAQARIAGVERVAIVEEILTAIRARDRQIVLLCEFLNLRAARGVPQATAQDRDRTPRGAQILR